MDRTHALSDDVSDFLTLGSKKPIMAFPDCRHQIIQLRDLLIAEATLHHDHKTNLVQCVISFRLTGQVIQLVAQILFHLCGGIKDLHFGLEKVFNLLQGFLAVEKIVFTL